MLMPKDQTELTTEEQKFQEERWAGVTRNYTPEDVARLRARALAAWREHYGAVQCERDAAERRERCRRQATGTGRLHVALFSRVGCL